MAALCLGRHAAAAVRAAQVQALRSVVVLVPSHWTPGVMYAPLRRALEATGDYTTDLFAYSRHESRWEALTAVSQPTLERLGSKHISLCVLPSLIRKQAAEALAEHLQSRRQRVSLGWLW